MKHRKKSRVHQEVLRLGKDIIRTPEFQKTRCQRHHLKTTLAHHSLHVAEASIFLANLTQKFGADVDKSLLVTAALCHDLGMLGRDSYENTRAQYRQHPKDAVKIVENRLDIHNGKLNNAIESHMFPLNGTAPRSREARILVLADKIGSVMDLLGKRNKPEKTSEKPVLKG